MLKLVLLVGLLVALAPATDPPGGPAPVPQPVRFGRDVRPLLSDRCFQCHGGDPSSRQAELRLDLREAATADRGGYAAVVPGDAAASELWARVTSGDPDLQMPPPDAKKRPLSAEDRALLARWIEEGAAYEGHWAYEPPRAEPPPAVDDADWARDPLDAFVLARIEAAGLRPSRPADAATLARRVFLDLTGLPPTVEELDAFLAAVAREERPGAAYDALVDHLLGAEPYRSRLAEHLAVPWLDAARYGDTNGIHTDNGRQMWLWRDGLLAALRDNQPFDQFVIEQLAGDLLPDATVAQRIASGFNRNHVTTDEGGAIPEEYLLEYAVDRVNTVSEVFLGMTAGCARCHDHKFDPLTQRDYYGLLAFFNSIDEPGLYTQTEDDQRAYEPSLLVPSAEQTAQLEELAAYVEELGARLEQPIPGELEEREAFLAGVAEDLGLEWTTPRVLRARSSEPDTRWVAQPDGAVLAEGVHPMQEDLQIVLRTEAEDLRLLLLEALSVPGQVGAGRASHGNAVLSTLRLDARPAGGGPWEEVPLVWAWADHTQTNLDFEPTRVLDTDHALGFAVDGNENAGPRDLLLLSERAFGHAGGSELRLRVAFRSPYAQHSLGRVRVRVRVSPLADTRPLAPALGRWWRVGPFGTSGGFAPDALYETTFGPELGALIDREARFGESRRNWAFDGSLTDGVVSALGETPGVTFVGRTIWSPDARLLRLELGSDDGLVVFHDGVPLREVRVERGAELGQNAVDLALHPGLNTLVLKIVNTGGPTAFACEVPLGEEVLAGELGSALLPPDAVHPEQVADFERSFRRTRSASWRELDDAREAAVTERAALEAVVPATMVMVELPEPRATYVLERGQYDRPDREQPVARRTPAFLPPLPADAPADRLGLARWLVAPENPLLARVTVNRLWAQVFGEGLVHSVEDFGLQGSWPTHPELLDRLAVDFRESGWDVHALLRRLVTSATYRQSSVLRPELVEADPGNTLLARAPRRRLGAEQIRDLALHASGLLVERFGGPSVKPYQPEGLWREVAMLVSNTRDFERSEGDGLWRRSVYSYWKRAVPPPTLMLLDAPTRESCVTRRQLTNTPLQALALWNDEQFVEAARALAERALQREGDEAERVVWLARSCTARRPTDAELAALREALAGFRERFAADAEAAAALVSVGEAPRAGGLDDAELAAWTLLANAVLNLHETLTRD